MLVKEAQAYINRMYGRHWKVLFQLKESSFVISNTRLPKHTTVVHL